MALLRLPSPAGLQCRLARPPATAVANPANSEPVVADRVDPSRPDRHQPVGLSRYRQKGLAGEGGREPASPTKGSPATRLVDRRLVRHWLADNG